MTEQERRKRAADDATAAAVLALVQRIRLHHRGEGPGPCPKS